LRSFSLVDNGDLDRYQVQRFFTKWRCPPDLTAPDRGLQPAKNNSKKTHSQISRISAMGSNGLVFGRFGQIGGRRRDLWVRGACEFREKSGWQASIGRDSAEVPSCSMLRGLGRSAPEPSSSGRGPSCRVFRRSGDCSTWRSWRCSSS
jgi:hypothetical protein